MWHLIRWRTQVMIVTVCVLVLAWAADGSYESLQGRSAPLLKFISIFATTITLGVVGIASLIWRSLWQRFPIIGRKTFRDLNGTWEGTLVSTWIDPATNQPIPPIKATIWIRQTLFSMSIKLKAAESTSYSTRYFLEADPERGAFSRVVLV